MRVLITGGSGLLGSALVISAPVDLDVEATRYRREPAVEGPRPIRRHRCDLTQPGAAFELLHRRRPDLVIHTAYSKTDASVTIDSTTEVAAACAALDVDLVHISTDAVFDGDHAPYAEDAVPRPVHAYGRAKRTAELAVLEQCPAAAIVRTSLILAADGSDETTAWAIAANRRAERVTFFVDEFRMPIAVHDLAAQLWELVALGRAGRAGVWHLVGPERLSRAEIGRSIVARFDLDASTVDEASAATTGTPRPRDLSLGSVRAPGLLTRPGSVRLLGAGTVSADAEEVR
ncbi:MAG: sugar nucleotide-binding protein [Microthrixaceae bacterium]